ncbi:MAG: DUF2164 family protein [Candidatus Saccharimonadales bacterium]
MIKKWDIKDEQIQRKCIDEILTRLEEQDGTEFGILAAEDIIETVANYIGPQSYNSGLEDAKSLIQSKISDIEVELDILKTSV